MQRVQKQQQNKCQTKLKRKTPEHRLSSQNYLTVIHISNGYFLCDVKFTTIPRRNNIEPKSEIQNHA